jgi:opacity protein-like surface antigen
MRRRIAALALALASLTLSAKPALANKIDTGFGYYTIAAKRGADTATLSNLGLFYVGYRRAVLDRLEIGVNYGIIYSGSIGSNAGYGIDVFACYFPLNSAKQHEHTEGNVTVEVYDRFKPFVSAGIQQRAFQSGISINTVSFLGYGAGAGLETAVTRRFSLKTEATYYLLYGPSDTSAGELDLKAGLTFRF